MSFFRLKPTFFYFINMTIKTNTIPYLYFMDTTDLSVLCPVSGQDNLIHFKIGIDDGLTIPISYRPTDIVSSTRSIVLFGGLNKCDWKQADSHMFYVDDSNLSMNYSILKKFHNLLGIAFCKYIGQGKAAFYALKMSSMFSEITPWTMTLAINPSGPIGDLNFGSIREKVGKGRHVFYLLENRLDNKLTFLKNRDKLLSGGIQGWKFQAPASTFYNDNTKDHSLLPISSEMVFRFLDWISVHLPEAEGVAGTYKVEREF